MLTELQQGLAGLKDREREALALRFAAGLKLADIGVVLGITEGAAKMLVARAVSRLDERLPGRPGAAIAPESATQLDGIIDGVLSRGHHSLGDEGLRSLVLHLAVVHQPPVREGLPDRIAACVGCRPDRGAGGIGSGGGTRMRAAGPRMGSRPFAGLGWALMGPACLGCVLPGVWPGLAALGLLWPAVALHNIGLLLAPVMMWLLWSQYRSMVSAASSPWAWPAAAC